MLGSDMLSNTTPFVARHYQQQSNAASSYQRQVDASKAPGLYLRVDIDVAANTAHSSRSRWRGHFRAPHSAAALFSTRRRCGPAWRHKLVALCRRWHRSGPHLTIDCCTRRDATAVTPTHASLDHEIWTRDIDMARSARMQRGRCTGGVFAFLVRSQHKGPFTSSHEVSCFDWKN